MTMLLAIVALSMVDLRRRFGASTGVGVMGICFAALEQVRRVNMGVKIGVRKWRRIVDTMVNFW